MKLAEEFVTAQMTKTPIPSFAKEICLRITWIRDHARTQLRISSFFGILPTDFTWPFTTTPGVVKTP